MIEKHRQHMCKWSGYGACLTVNDFGVVFDTGTLDLGLFVFHILVPELGIIADAVGRTSVSHRWRYMGDIKMA